MPAEAPPQARPLADHGVLVTRPARQAERLTRQLEGLGARVLRFPLVRIGPPTDPDAAQARLAELARADLVVFVSANAVRFAFELLPGLAARLEGVRLACLGEATAAALRACGLGVDLVPREGNTSEALLATEPLQREAIAGCEVGVVKGEGGRDLLLDALQARGARVAGIDVYRRELPTEDLPAFLDAHAGEIAVVVITSGEALEHFVRLGGLERVRALPLVVPSERVAQRAAALGLTGPRAAPPRVSDAELARATVGLVQRLSH
jgi:uroporphyrinogen-III synthase